jgi:methionyl-tRNA formyltransferase
MKTILFTNSGWSIPMMISLAKAGELKGIVLPERDHEALTYIQGFAAEREIQVFKSSKDQLQSELLDWVDELKCDVGLCMSFPYLFPEALLKKFKKGLYNFHFGRLPEYAGGDPLFWTLKNQVKTAVISVHLMNTDLDSGQLMIQEQVSIFPGENYGILGARLSQISATIPTKLFALIEANHVGKFISPNPNPFTTPNSQDLIVDWNNQSSESIEALVNAANPSYGGAVTFFRNTLVRILEVSPADVPNAALLGPGTIVHATVSEGLFVLCSDYRFLRLNIIQTPETILTGNKLVALGIKTNEKFGKPKAQSSQTVV